MLIKLEINKEKILGNLKRIKKINENIIWVLKDDAYGLGIGNILPILIKEKCNNFAVAYIEEAIFLKNFVFINYEKKEKPINIMCLNYIETNDLEKAINNEIGITLFSLTQLDKYIEKLKQFDLKKKIKFHLKFNTGMNRLGFNIKEIEILSKKLKEINESGIDFEINSVYSHIAHSENENETKIQVKLYDKILEKLVKNEIKYKFRHLQASPLLFKYKEKYNYDFARIGMALYGMEPLSQNIGLFQTVNLISKIICIRDIKKGEQVSYGNSGIVKRDSKVAIIPVGYAHGLQKQIEDSEAFVLINKQKAKILGEVCMDMIIVDITDIKDVKVEDKVTILGKDGENEITLKQMAQWANTIQDDILTKFNKDIEKILV